jgi:hypothetical protein
MSGSPWTPFGQRGRRSACTFGLFEAWTGSRGTPGTDPWGLRAVKLNKYPKYLPKTGPDPGSAAPRRRLVQELILLATLLLAQSLPRKRFFCPALLTGLHVEAMLLYFLDDVFLLYLAFEAPQGILKRLTLLDNYFCHWYFTPVPVRISHTQCLPPYCNTAPVYIIA